MNGYNSQSELSVEEWTTMEQDYMMEAEQLYAYQQSARSSSQDGVYYSVPEIQPFKYPDVISSPLINNNYCSVTPHESACNFDYINAGARNTPCSIFHQEPSIEDWAAQEAAFVQEDLNISCMYSNNNVESLGKTNIKVTLCDAAGKDELISDHPSILLTDQEAFTSNSYNHETITDKSYSENEVNIYQNYSENHFINNDSYTENVSECYVHNTIGNARYAENETLSNGYFENRIVSDNIYVGNEVIDYDCGKPENFPLVAECISIKDSNVNELTFDGKADVAETNSCAMITSPTEKLSKEPSVEEWAAQEAAYMQESEDFVTNWSIKPSCFENSLNNQSVSVNYNFQQSQKIGEDINVLNEENTGYQINRIKSNINVDISHELLENTYRKSDHNFDSSCLNQSRGVSVEQEQVSFTENNQTLVELLDVTGSRESISENSSCTTDEYLNLWDDYINTKPLDLNESVETNEHYNEAFQNSDTDTVIVANKKFSVGFDEQSHLFPASTNWNEKESRDIKFSQNMDDDAVEDEDDLDYEIVKMSGSSSCSSTYVVKPLSSFKDSDFLREHLLVKVHRLLKLLLPKFINGFQQQDLIKIVVLIGETDHVISTNFVTLKEMTVEFLVKEVDLFCSNKSKLLYFLQKEVYVTVICQINSVSRKNHMLANPFTDVKSKQGIIYISNRLGMSLARAIVVAKAFHDKHAYKELFNCHRKKQQDILATLLHSQANVPTRPCTLEDIPKFESVINMRIMVWSAGDYNKLVYKGLQELDKRQQLHIWFTYGRYHAVLKPNALLGKLYYCWRCCKAYSCDRKKHRKVCSEKLIQTC